MKVILFFGFVICGQCLFSESDLSMKDYRLEQWIQKLNQEINVLISVFLTLKYILCFQEQGTKCQTELNQLKSTIKSYAMNFENRIDHVRSMLSRGMRNLTESRGKRDPDTQV